MAENRHEVDTRLGVSLAAARSALAAAGGPFMRVFERVSMSLELYAPQGRDLQTPHRQDELYRVSEGRGVYRCGASQVAFGPGDAPFAPAGVEHRFEDFSADLEVWVVFYGPFYGPEGGEG